MIMKVTKRQLKRIIKEEKRKLLKESGGVGIGFSNWSVNKNPDFAKAYGKDARVLHDFGSNSARQNELQEQGYDVHGSPVGHPVHGDDSPYATPGTAGHTQAMDDLEMELVNTLSRALGEGLIIDDLNDAWQNALAYAEDMMDVR